MLRFLAPLTLALALLGAAPASAGLAPKLYTGQTKLGEQTSSRSDGGSCTVEPGLLTNLVLHCDDSTGRARVKYLFTLPKKAGSVTAQVSFLGAHRGAVVSTKRVSDTLFRVVVMQDSAGGADIVSATIEYYVG